MTDVFPYWSISSNDLIQNLNTSSGGLSSEEAKKRRSKNQTASTRSPLVTDLFLFFTQYKSPLMVILIFAVLLSAFLGEYVNSFIILGIILLSSMLGFWQERNANHALQKLQAMVQVNATVIRDGKIKDIPMLNVVRGDIVLLNAGDIIPGDSVLLEANDLHISEATLTGESFPVEKEVCLLSVDTELGKRKNCVFQGTSVVNGTAKILVVQTGTLTEFGKIVKELEKHTTETAFEKGIKKFGYMILQITFVLSLLILILNIYLGKPIINSVLFALALAVGMAPELLPTIVTITLSAGAKRMAEKKVIVKKLSSIQNLGAVNVFCSDKTGTLTEGIVKVHMTVDGDGNHWDKVKIFSYLNAKFETGFTNPLDDAIRNIPNISVNEYQKIDEVPYDFIRKRLSIVVEFEKRHLLITKGAVKNILEVCTMAEFDDGSPLPLNHARKKIEATKENFNMQGFRTIGVCYKDITGDPVITKSDEYEMTFLGMVVLADSIKPGIASTVKDLQEVGIRLKLITGDSKLVAAYVSSQIGLNASLILTGSDLRKISDDALSVKANEIDVFAETEPDQKERIVRVLQKSGNVVGYMGDGINDASALRISDVGISVDSAVDVAKESADIVFLEKDLEVLRDGILEGRKTFINTLKYIFITTSANFGNMFSVAGTSLFLPFLPLLPKQILLLNFFSDIPAMTIASDRVDSELLSKPRKWDTSLIRNFMIVFGIESSLFDFLTFGILLWLFHANIAQFQTGWFIESCITEILILLIIRTQRSFIKSKPGKYLMYVSAMVIIGIVLLPYLPGSHLMGFTHLPLSMLIGMGCIALVYAVVAELTKKMFFKRIIF